MDINELFDRLQDEGLMDNLNGELILEENSIIWTYDLNKNSKEIEASDDDDFEEQEFYFESSSSEELLLETYDEDLENIQEILDELGETDNWTFSEPETNKTIISFRIF